jgi:outer membrane protein OmpA-like peptidoglycan-associated protein/tetratricopeptide (TPR) repeat protein
MKMKRLLLFVCCSGIILYLIPKTLLSDDLGKANKFYEKYDYNYAIEIYQQLLDDNPTLEVAQKLANCYRFTNNTIAAEKAYANVLTFPGFDPVNYLYYAEVLKQNTKFDLAKLNYLKYAERLPEKSDEAVKLANGCDAARLWLANPEANITVTNESDFNSENSDFSPIAYKKGFILVSDREFLKPVKPKSKKVYGWTGNPYLKLYQAENANDTLDGSLKLTLMPEQINDRFHSGSATLSKDENVMYFTKAGKVDGIDYGDNKDRVVMKKAIYYSVKSAGMWSEAISFPYNSPLNFSLEHPALSPDGKILYFASDMPGTLGGMDIFYSENTGSGWTRPVNCGPSINTAQDEVFPYVRKDGTLFFSSRGHITIGGLDLFSANGEKNNWSDPENLKAPMNSSKDDFGIFYYPDNSTGFISSNRPGGKGSDDIYRFVEGPKELFFAVQGNVVDKKTGEPLEGLIIYLVDKKTGEQTNSVSAADGSFKFDLKKNSDYIVRGDLDKYFSKQEGDISTKGASESTVYNVKFEVEKGEEAFLVRLNNIYYDFDKFNIRKDAEPELKKVLDFMNTTLNVSVEMRSHTDSRGNADYNMKLSEKRAGSAKDYLIKKGADKGRLTARGFGETLLLNKCADGVKCTKEEHQMNRRTEFKVVKVAPVVSYIPNFFISPNFPFGQTASTQ